MKILGESLAILALSFAIAMIGVSKVVSNKFNVIASYIFYGLCIASILFILISFS